MGSSTRPFAAQIAAARTHVARVRQRLLHPAAGTLAEALPELERAILLLRESEGLAGPGAGHARELQNELTQVKALARQAHQFYAMKIRLLAQNDSPIDYTRAGVTSQQTCQVPLQTPLQTVSHQGLIVHG
jgi:hypothetical protein